MFKSGRRKRIATLVSVVASVRLIVGTLTVDAETCEPAPTFASLASALTVPIGDCVSIESSDGNVTRQAFSFGEFVMRSSDGGKAFISSDTAWSLDDGSLNSYPAGEWLKPTLPANGAEPSADVSVPALGAISDAATQASRSVHRVRVGDEWGTAVSTTLGILTSAHLVQNVEYVELVTSDGELVLANVVRRDEILDVALLDAPVVLAQIEVPDATRVLLNQEAVVLGYRADTEDGSGGGRTVVSIRGRVRQSSGLHAIAIDGQLRASETGGALVATDGRFLGLFAYSRREPGEAHLAVAVESLREFEQSTSSRTLVPRQSAAGSRIADIASATPTLRPPPSPLPSRTSTPVPLPTKLPLITAPSPTPPSSDSRVIRREFFDSVSTSLQLGVNQNYEFSIHDREYRIYSKAVSGRYTNTISVVPLTSYNERDIVISLVARLVGPVEGRHIILACRSTDNLSQYRVTISTEYRSFVIDKLINNQFLSQPVPWKVEPAIESNPRDKNSYEFSCVGSEFKFKINGKQVATFTDIEIPEGRAWFTASHWKEVVGDTDARFSNILVTRGQ